MLQDRRLRIAWKAYLAEGLALQLAEHPSRAVVAERMREYLSNRLERAIRVLSEDSSLLADILVEMLEIAIGEEEIIGWRPPAGAGNYAGEEAETGDWPSGWTIIKGYNDGYAWTSPVGSFAAIGSGLYDMGGNVWQWCEDWYNATEQSRVLRGASWLDGYPDTLLASYRDRVIPDIRYDFNGFRCVVAAESSR
jgi:hypothetical protein